MTVSFKAPVKSAVVNNAFVSKQADDTKVGKFALNKLSEGSQIFSVQKSINELFDVSGTGEGDPNAKNYANENYIANGDNQKIAIEKLDANLKGVSDSLDAHVNSPEAHTAASIVYDNTDSELIAIDVQAAIDEVELRVDTAEAEIVALDGRVETNEDDILAINNSIGAANGICPLNASTQIDSTYLPSYVDDVLEFADLASFPVTGETGKIYVALDTNKTYRWSGSAYIEVSPNDVNSVNGETGIVVLDADDIDETATRYWSRKNNVAVVDPISSNDSDENYSVGSQWYNSVSGVLFICQDATATSAIWNEISGSGGVGGGGSFIWEKNGDLSPIEEVQNGFSLFTFDALDEKSVYAMVNIPENYNPSIQIKIKSMKVFGDTTGNVLIRSESTLFSEDTLISSTTNTHDSVNTELTIGTANAIKYFELDLTDSVGEINGVAVQPNDMILVRLYRDFANETTPSDNAKILKYSASLSFS
jgi:hypothetical protein